jgi:hypothetical protein
MLALRRSSRQLVVAHKQLDGTDMMGEFRGKRQRFADQPCHALAQRVALPSLLFAAAFVSIDGYQLSIVAPAPCPDLRFLRLAINAVGLFFCTNSHVASRLYVPSSPLTSLLRYSTAPSAGLSTG